MQTFISLFLVFQTYLVLNNPKFFLVNYLIFVSSFLGFLSKVFLINGSDIGLFYQNFLMIGCVLLNYKSLLELPKNIKILLLIFLIIFLYGLFQSVYTSISSPFQSLVGSKEFTTIFLTHYLFVNRQFFSFNFIYEVISFFGYFYLLVMLFFLIFNYVPPYYVKGNSFEFYFPSILSLFLFIKAIKSINIFQKIFFIFLLLIWGFGIYYEGHFSILFSTVLGCLILLIKPVARNIFNNKTLISLLLLFVAFLVTVLPVRQYINYFNSIPSILSRSETNSERIDFIIQNPLFGYGFVDSKALSFDSVNKYAQFLYTIDSGYIDLLVKFGVIGSIIYLLPIFLNFIKPDKNYYSLAFKIFFIQLCFVNITWSVFTFSVGLLSLCFCIYLSYISSNLKSA